MSNEPPGANARSAVSNLFDPEQERAICCLRKHARILRSANFRGLKLDLPAASSALASPHWVFILDDGRALAWFGENRPYVVHPSFDDLCEMHGLRGALVHAA
jgi:hypothetical protein